MGNVDRFAAYAAAFEIFYKTDDETVLEPYFIEDAVYETIAGPPFGALTEGREAIFAQLKQSLATLDRRFDSRVLELLEGPEERDGSVWIRWRARYCVGDLPELVVEGEETATFDGDRISRLEDRFTDEASQGTLAWMAEFGDKLPPVA